MQTTLARDLLGLSEDVSHKLHLVVTIVNDCVLGMDADGRGPSAQAPGLDSLTDLEPIDSRPIKQLKLEDNAQVIRDEIRGLIMPLTLKVDKTVEEMAETKAQVLVCMQQQRAFQEQQTLINERSSNIQMEMLDKLKALSCNASTTPAKQPGRLPPGGFSTSEAASASSPLLEQTRHIFNSPVRPERRGKSAGPQARREEDHEITMVIAG